MRYLYTLGDVTTHNSRTDKHRIFKFSGGADGYYMTHHVWTQSKVNGQQSTSRSWTYK